MTDERLIGTSNRPDSGFSGLVPVISADRGESGFNFTAAQKQLLSKLAFTYLKTHRISFRTVNAQRVQEVICVDAITRGLAVLHENLKPDTNINNIVRAGLRDRERAVSETRRVLYGLPGKGTEVVGQYAFSSRFVNRVKAELESPLLHPTLNACERLVARYKLREAALPILADEVIALLPQELFPDASVDKFPTLEEKASIVRNSIVSLIGRGHLLPAISVEEVRSIISDQSFKALSRDELFAGMADIVKSVADKLGVSITDVIDYIADLQGQVVDQSGSYSFFGGDSTQERVKVFTAFSRVLLLMHPLLEERELITDPDRVKESRYSLWGAEYSREILGHLVPGPDILIKAQATQRARGKYSVRFATAIDLWRGREKGAAQSKSRIDSLERQIARAREAITEVSRKPVRKVSDKEVELISLKNPRLVEEFKSRRHDIVMAESLKNKMRRLRAQITETEKLLASDEEFTGRVPRWFTKGSDAAVTIVRERTRNEYDMATVRFGELTADDAVFFRICQDGSFMKFVSDSSPEDLQQKLDEWQKLVLDLEATEDPFYEVNDLTTGDVLSFTDIRIRQYKEMLKVHDMKVARKSPQQIRFDAMEDSTQRDFYMNKIMEQSGLQEMLSGYRGAAHSQGVPAPYMLWSLKNCSPRLSRVINTKRHYLAARDKRPRVPRREDLVYRVKKLKAQVIVYGEYDPNIVDRYYEDFLELNTILSKRMVDGLGYGSLPAIIPDKDDFEGYIDQKIGAYEAMIAKLQRRKMRRKDEGKKLEPVHGRDPKVHIASLQVLRRNLDNPFLSFSECIGLSGMDFRSVVLGRATNFYNQRNGENAKRDYALLLEELRKKAKVVRREQLEQQGKRYAREIEQEKQVDFDQDFLQRMIELKLAVPAGVVDPADS